MDGIRCGDIEQIMGGIYWYKAGWDGMGWGGRATRYSTFSEAAPTTIQLATTSQVDLCMNQISEVPRRTCTSPPPSPLPLLFPPPTHHLRPTYSSSSLLFGIGSVLGPHSAFVFTQSDNRSARLFVPSPTDSRQFVHTVQYTHRHAR